MRDNGARLLLNPKKKKVKGILLVGNVGEVDGRYLIIFKMVIISSVEFETLLLE